MWCPKLIIDVDFGSHRRVAEIAPKMDCVEHHAVKRLAPSGRGVRGDSKAK